MKFSTLVLLMLLGLSLFAAVPAVLLSEESGQPSSGLITGTVRDRSGATMPGVVVVLSSPAGLQRETVTDEEGRYRFDQLKPEKNYSLRAFVPGFGAATVSRITVRKDRNTTVVLRLTAGATPTPSARPTPSATAVPNVSPSPRASPSVAPSPVYSPSPNSSPSPRVSPTPLDLETVIREEAAKLQESKITFNPPTNMLEQKTETIQARISFREPGPEFSQGLEGPGTPQEAPLKVSEIMTVTLTGDGNAFLIQPIGDQEQVIAGKPYAQWEWRVTPLRSGDQRLTLTASAKILLPGRGEKQIYYETFKQAIVVKVDRWYTVKTFIGNNWQWLWAVVIVPAAGLLWGLRRRRIRRAGFR